MKHYLYLLTFNDGMKYVGARSTTLDYPELDTNYLGSGRHLPVRSLTTCSKQILATYPSRDELIKAEIQYINSNKCVESEFYYNKRTATYDRHGDKCESASKALKGRTAMSHKYIEEAAIKNKKYTGENRTLAQKHKDAKARGVSTGPNPLKGNSGTTNSAFIPWYSISPEGVKKEYHDITKQDAAPEFGLTPRQMVHRFHYTNIDKPAKRGKIKGWVFGNL